MISDCYITIYSEEFFVDIENTKYKTINLDKSWTGSLARHLNWSFLWNTKKHAKMLLINENYISSCNTCKSYLPIIMMNNQYYYPVIIELIPENKYIIKSRRYVINVYVNEADLFSRVLTLCNANKI
jgi:hypothetical protein